MRQAGPAEGEPRRGALFRAGLTSAAELAALETICWQAEQIRFRFDLSRRQHLLVAETGAEQLGEVAVKGTFDRVSPHASAPCRVRCRAPERRAAVGGNISYRTTLLFHDGIVNT
jgi:hypothetical protein